MSRAALQPDRPHSALVWLIRGTGALIAAVSAITGGSLLLAILFAAGRSFPLDFLMTLVVLSVVGYFCWIRRTKLYAAIAFTLIACFFLASISYSLSSGHPAEFSWLGGSLGMLFVVGLFYAIFYTGYCMWRTVDKAAVGNFSFLFAMLLAIDWYHMLPPHLPKSINDHLWLAFRDMGNHPGGLSYRYWWATLAFWLFYKLIAVALRQLFHLNPPPSSPPQNPDFPDPSVPEYPQRSPLTQL